jgi:hypothetical protein
VPGKSRPLRDLKPLFLAAALALAVTAALPSSAAAIPGDISTVAGNGTLGSAGNDGPATAAELNLPRDVAVLPGGGFLIADTANNEIREVSPTGVITVVAGTGTGAYNGDNIPAVNAQLNGPRGVEPLPGGGFLIADFANQRVRWVDVAGFIHTVAGNGTPGFGGDGGPATSASVELPRDVSLAPDGGYLIGEHLADCVRKVDASGTITTVAGVCGASGNSGNGGPATAATFVTVNGVNSFADGSFIVTDGPSDAVREVGTDGIIRAAAGNGTSGFSGDGGPATSAAIDGPRQAAALPGGAFLFADHNNNRIRMVGADGVISTVAGTGTAGFSGDGGAAVAAQLSGPESVAALYNGSAFNGGMLIADADNQRIRKVEGTPPVVKPSNDFSFGKLRRNKRRGVAFLPVTFPGPGSFTLSGTGIKGIARASSSSARGVAAAGTIELPIRASGKKRKRLKKTGKVKVTAIVTYTPKLGDPNTKSLTVKLIKKKRHHRH